MFNSKTIQDLKFKVIEFAKKNTVLTAIIAVVVVFVSYNYISNAVRNSNDEIDGKAEVVVDIDFLMEEMRTDYFIDAVAELKPLMTEMVDQTNSEIELAFSGRNRKTDDDIRRELRIRENPYDSNGKRLIPIYEGARWFGSESRDLGKTEAEIIPNGLMQDEIIITLLTFNLKHELYFSHEVSERHGKEKEVLYA
ncbi:MAG: hypothetical protein FWG90_01960 [Oscillospiraceae bacterium]|nr:hypothetical protein [Oscillospiraceae bacterium]